ncbi:recombination-associated protein RdgC [Salmonella enterica]|uniref:recombination-associated protein RdgC n=1 Tax=Salmonella enterica TaxID=28901 RepID=UPI00111C9B09|nr:recombination-associated protein RdgC [Salmonella enterica]TPB56615.1 recombination-associated protein RdgC [Salmonella enterica subsp. enterica serovar Goldcoast]
MKIKGYEKAIILHLGALYDAANEGNEKVKPLHRLILNLPNVDEEAVTAFAKGAFSDALEKHEVSDPPEASYKTMGFAAYGEEVESKFALAIPGTNAIVFQIEKRERVLPGVSVRNEVVKRMAALREKEIDGWEPNRKDWAQMKDDVEAEMLKHAPIRPSRVNVILSAPFVYVFTSSAKTAEECSALIRTALGTWPVEHLLPSEYELRQLMQRAVLGQQDGIKGDAFIHLKHDDGDDVKMKDTDIFKDESVVDLLSRHWTVRALDLEVDTQCPGIDTVYFRLSDKAILSGIHIGEADVDANYDATLERYGTDGGQFLTMMANLFQLDKSLRAVISVLDEAGQVVEYTGTLNDEEDDDEV